MQSGSTMNERWFSVDEVAGHLGVARDTVYRWIEHRGLPAKKIGRLWKLKLSEVDGLGQRRRRRRARSPQG